MCAHGTVERDNTAVGKKLAQMIECAPIAKTDFHDGASGQVHIAMNVVENIALRAQAANEAV